MQQLSYCHRLQSSGAKLERGTRGAGLIKHPSCHCGALAEGWIPADLKDLHKNSQEPELSPGEVLPVINASALNRMVSKQFKYFYILSPQGIHHWLRVRGLWKAYVPQGEVKEGHIHII